MATVITVKSKNQNQISTLNPNEQSRKDINLNNQNHNAIIIIKEHSNLRTMATVINYITNQKSESKSNRTVNPNEQSRQDITSNNQNNNTVIINHSPIFDNRIHHKHKKIQMES
jgi:hypothetical protein